jgi:hypothetical protein
VAAQRNQETGCFRLPARYQDLLRARARACGVAPGTLLRQWVVDWLDAGRAPDARAGRAPTVADLERAAARAAYAVVLIRSHAGRDEEGLEEEEAAAAVREVLAAAPEF